MSGPEQAVQSTLDKLELLNAKLRTRFKQFWTPGTHLAVDETIQRFMGRAKEIVNIPTKPEPEGFKIWVLANCGYVLDWMYHCKGAKYGPYDVNTYYTETLGFSKTQAVVLDLLSQLNEFGCDRFNYIVWLDNLFTSVRLLTQLEEYGYGAAGTIRTTKTVERRKKLKEVLRPSKKSFKKRRTAA